MRYIDSKCRCCLNLLACQSFTSFFTTWTSFFVSNVKQYITYWKYSSSSFYSPEIQIHKNL